MRLLVAIALLALAVGWTYQWDRSADISVVFPVKWTDVLKVSPLVYGLRAPVAGDSCCQSSGGYFVGIKVLSVRRGSISYRVTLREGRP